VKAIRDSKIDRAILFSFSQEISKSMNHSLLKTASNYDSDFKMTTLEITSWIHSNQRLSVEVQRIITFWSASDMNFRYKVDLDGMNAIWQSLIYMNFIRGNDNLLIQGRINFQLTPMSIFYSDKWLIFVEKWNHS
jgi:hypothetical protein